MYVKRRPNATDNNRSEVTIDGVKFVRTRHVRIKYGYTCLESRWYVNGKHVNKRQFRNRFVDALQEQTNKKMDQTQ